MSFAVIGVNHKTAQVALREQLAFSPENSESALLCLFQHPLVDGCLILSTCNRTEIYVSFDQTQCTPHQITESLVDWLMAYHHLLDHDDVISHLYHYENEDAITHLMRVACGLDSLVLGEPQILGQVKQAFAMAHQAKTLNDALSRLVQKVFSVAKRIRTETKIGASTVSVAYAACLMVQRVFTHSQDIVVLLVGAGETIELIARYLKQHSLKKVIVSNRTPERAQAVTRHLDGEVEIIGLPDIAHRLKDADVVISSTASPLPIIGKGMVERSLSLRQQKPMLMIDLAVPRDIEPEVSELAHTHLYTVDDLQGIIQDNLAQRRVAAQEAEYILQEECAAFMLWLQQKRSIEVVCRYRQSAEAIQAELTAKALCALERGESAESVIRELAYKLTHKLIHTPTMQIKETDVTEREALNQLMKLIYQ